MRGYADVMKRRSKRLTAAAVVFFLMTSAASAAGIHWVDYPAGLALAKAHHKTMLVYFYADWCHWCQKMKAETLSDARVIKILNRAFISVRVNIDTGKELTREYGVRPIPVIWFVSDKGKPIGHRPGFLDADHLIEILGYMKHPPT